eukprot:8292257-Lingulodinium_polyedra.AAC.1
MAWRLRGLRCVWCRRFGGAFGYQRSVTATSTFSGASHTGGFNIQLRRGAVRDVVFQPMFEKFVL